MAARSALSKDVLYIPLVLACIVAACTFGLECEIGEESEEKRGGDIDEDALHVGENKGIINISSQSFTST
jgi:hypothetical protein